MKNIKHSGWVITSENVKKFPFRYVLDCEDQSEGYCDFELGDNKETTKLFEKYSYLLINSKGNLYGIKNSVFSDIMIDGTPLTDEEIGKLEEIYVKVN